MGKESIISNLILLSDLSNSHFSEVPLGISITTDTSPSLNIVQRSSDKLKEALTLNKESFTPVFFSN